MKRVILLLNIAGHYLYISSTGSVYCRSHDSLEFRSYYLCLGSNTFIISQGSMLHNTGQSPVGTAHPARLQTK